MKLNWQLERDKLLCNNPKSDDWLSQPGLLSDYLATIAPNTDTQWGADRLQIFFTYKDLPMVLQVEGLSESCWIEALQSVPQKQLIRLQERLNMVNTVDSNPSGASAE